MTTRLDVLDPSESMVLTFDFSLGLAAGETLIATPTASVTVDFGADPNAAAIIKTVTLNSPYVFVAVSGLLDQTDYHIHCLCPTSNAQKILMDAGVLPCRVQ